MPMWCVAPLEMKEGNSLGQGYNRPTGCSAEKAPHATFNFLTHNDDDISTSHHNRGIYMTLFEQNCNYLKMTAIGRNM